MKDADSGWRIADGQARNRAPGGWRLGPLARIHALRAIRTVPVQQAGGRGAPLRALTIRYPLSAIPFFLLLAVIACNAAPASQGEDAFSLHMKALTATLPEPAQRALDSIDSPQRKLLAARSYAKVGDSLTSRWSWTEQEIRQFETSHQHRQLLGAVQAVIDRFEEQNPGYSLYANMNVRSLDVQLERWNSNPRVGVIAAELYSRLSREVTSRGYPDQPTEESVNQLKTLLMTSWPSSAAPLAAPGLSAHGQLRAVDFQVTKGGQIVAGTSIAAVARTWERQGWHRKLLHAVQSVGDLFAGPLRAPNEPWHYSYIP